MNASYERASGFTWRRRARLAAQSPGLDWLAAETCISPTLSPDGSTLAVVSDRDGTPRVWLSPVTQPGPPCGWTPARTMSGRSAGRPMASGCA
jgi:hypothetical protein